MNSELLKALLLCVLIGYLLGCFSPSFVVGKKKGYDVRESGSKNAGASNTVIMAGKFAGLMVALADMGKAALSWYIGKTLFPKFALAAPVCGVACVFGHMYPVFLGFRGGKGFACLGGIVLAFSPKSFVFMLTIALALGVLTNYVCIVTCAMWGIFPLYYGALTQNWQGMLVLLIPLLPVLFKHMENFRRIKKGQELRLSFLWDKEGERERLGYED